jgi:hypothetical protein
MVNCLYFQQKLYDSRMISQMNIYVHVHAILWLICSARRTRPTQSMDDNNRFSMNTFWSAKKLVTFKSLI